MISKALLFLLPLSLLFSSCYISDLDTPSQRFETLYATKWNEVFFDPCTEDWRQRWFLDGEVGNVANSADGMTLMAGPEFRNDAR